MQYISAPGSRRTAQKFAALLAVVLAAIWAIALAAPAVAHDVLVSSEPADGAEVESPNLFMLTFNNDPIDLNPVIAISGPDGQEKAIQVDPVVEGRDVYAELPELTPGTYEASWRVVSSDGHPISGNQNFTVVEGEEPGDNPPEEDPAEDPDTPTSSDDSSAAPDSIEEPSEDLEGSADGTTDDDSATGDAETFEPSDSNGIHPAVFIVAGVIAIGAIAAILVARRAKANRPTDPSK